MRLCIVFVLWVVSLPALWLGDPGQQLALVITVPFFDVPADSAVPACETTRLVPELVELDSVQDFCALP